MDWFKSIATQDQKYVQELVRYVHLNPVRAGVCKNIDELDAYHTPLGIIAEYLDVGCTAVSAMCREGKEILERYKINF
jgi:hypothetical protein